MSPRHVCLAFRLICVRFGGHNEKLKRHDSGEQGVFDVGIFRTKNKAIIAIEQYCKANVVVSNSRSMDPTASKRRTPSDY